MPEIISIIMNIQTEFDGVFRFTNATDEDFVALWNNKEYIFPAQSTCPMIIEGEAPESIQEIRKRFAKRLAEREYFKSKDFLKIANGTKSKDGYKHVIPSMYNESVLQPWIDACLEPLPVAKPVVKPRQKDDESAYKVAKAVDENENLNTKFKDVPIPTLGKME